jgi:4-phospho-D-threonate 3-dehydrogenase / 4-phospho-D-erythronate 3-dehydrogenase
VRPIIAITMGDAAGVGPEVVVKALARVEAHAICRPIVVGDTRRLKLAAALSRTSIDVRSCDSVADADFALDCIDCVDLGLIPDDLPFGHLSAVAGDAAFRYIERAIALALAQEIDAICTAPVNKAALHAGGHVYPGHTEILAHLTGTPEVSMMLSTPVLRVIHCTTHVGLLDAIARIDPPLVERTIVRGHGILARWGVASPRIAVCGINPHAGEGGLFGRGEEETQIAPAVAAARAQGIDVVGPLPADTLFFRAVRGDFDLVVAMYHDQGHCPVKVLGLDTGVNITVGLPVIRTSVDHGTAFDIAGTGVADERSLLEALRQAASLAGALEGCR